jgi:hypothetical protein
LEINLLFIFELLLFNGVILAWAGFEFWSVRRSKSHARSPAPDEPGHPEG